MLTRRAVATPPERVTTRDFHDIDDPEARKEAALAALAANRAARVDALRGPVLEALGGARRITLEVGCGHGHFLDDYAKEHPEEFCVGIDLRTKRIEKSNRKRERGGRCNLVFMKAEFTEFLDALPPDVSLGKIFFLFPDPWPKARHHRYRMIQTATLDALAAKAAPGCRLHFRTDHPDYFEWAQEHVRINTHWAINPELRWPFERETFFQKLLPDYRSLIAELTPAGVKSEG